MLRGGVSASASSCPMWAAPRGIEETHERRKTHEQPSASGSRRVSTSQAGTIGIRPFGRSGGTGSASTCREMVAYTALESPCALTPENVEVRAHAPKHQERLPRPDSYRRAALHHVRPTEAVVRRVSGRIFRHRSEPASNRRRRHPRGTRLPYRQLPPPPATYRSNSAKSTSRCTPARSSCCPTAGQSTPGPDLDRFAVCPSLAPFKVVTQLVGWRVHGWYTGIIS